VTFDWTGARADMTAIINDNPTTAALRRGSGTTASQTFRLEIAGPRGMQLQSDAARQATQSALILGAYNMDIAVGDRVTVNGILFDVVFVQPNRLSCTIAEAVVVE
jgi:hypothetical protein